MKKNIILMLLVLGLKVNSQNYINTAVPFINIPTDARSGGMADVGVSTSPDVYSQGWNPAKYPFMENERSLAFSISPWNNEDLQNTFLGQLFFFNKINKISAWGTSLKYFSLGSIEKIDIGIDKKILRTGEFKPREMTIDASYSMMLGKRFSMSVALRYIYSDIIDRTIEGNENYKPSNTIGVDISGMYIRKFKYKKELRAGFNISNIGQGISYGNLQSYNAIPTNLRLGVSYDFSLGINGKITFTVETNKLLVPTPNKSYEGGVLTTHTNENNNIFSDMFSSLYEAPGGFSEKIKEFTIQTGVEYDFKDKFFLRGGYFHESPDKGFRKFVTMGVGFLYESIEFDFSYLLSVSKFQTPLDNGMRVSLSIDLDKFNIFGN